MNIIVNFNKEKGITSHDAVQSVKKFFKVKKAGHAGTLDPIATGVILICLNEATKITGFLADLDKEYIMTAKLGESTDTYDSEGRIIKKVDISNISLGIEDIKKIIRGFIGPIEQVPPMFSAIKASGKPLYELARKGIEIERKPRIITINSIDIINLEMPFLSLKVSCSKGTYIRSLCNDIGNALGIGAHIVELTRTRIGDFSIENSSKISELPNKTSALHTIDSALRHLPEVRLKGDNLKRARNGNPFKLAEGDYQGHYIRLKDPDGRLLGIGKVTNGSVIIKRLFNF